MTSVRQSGNITPYHSVLWAADGVIADAGAPAAGRFMVAGRSFNFNTVNDQPIVFPQWVTAFRLAGIIITNASINLTTATGGFYPAASKGGTPIVANTQTYTILTSANALMEAQITAPGAAIRYSSNTLATIGGLLAVYFSLTTPQGVAARGDIYIAYDNLS